MSLVQSWCPISADLSWKRISSTMSWSAKLILISKVSKTKISKFWKHFLPKDIWNWKNTVCTVLSWCPVSADLSWKCISSTVSWSAKLTLLSKVPNNWMTQYDLVFQCLADETDSLALFLTTHPGKKLRKFSQKFWNYSLKASYLNKYCLKSVKYASNES